MARARTAGGDTASRIFRAAEDLLAERGYEGTSMNDVARRARVNKALVFYHFGTKAELFARVVDHYYEAQTAVLIGAFAKGGTVRERIHHLVDAYLDFCDEHRAFSRLLQEEIFRGGERLERIRRNLATTTAWAAVALGDVLPSEGPLAPKHILLTVSAIVVNYYLYAPLFGSLWGDDPMSEKSRAERREHVHWVVGLLLDALERDRANGAPR